MGYDRYLIAAVAFVSLIGYAALTLDWSFAVRINNAFIILATMWELNFLDALNTMTFSDAAIGKQRIRYLNIF